MPPRLRRFAAPVLDGHKGCAVEVPFHAGEAWGVEPSELVYGRVKGIPVCGVLARDSRPGKGVAFESWIVFRWGKHWLLLDDDTLDDAGLAPGRSARVEVGPKPEPKPAPEAAPAPRRKA